MSFSHVIFACHFGIKTRLSNFLLWCPLSNEERWKRFQKWLLKTSIWYAYEFSLCYDCTEWFLKSSLVAHGPYTSTSITAPVGAQIAQFMSSASLSSSIDQCSETMSDCYILQSRNDVVSSRMGRLRVIFQVEEGWDGGGWYLGLYVRITRP